MKKIISIFIIMLIAFSLFGCSMTNNQNDIEDICLIRVFGIDLKDDEYEVTVLYSKPTAPEQEPTYISVKGTGKSVYEAYGEIEKINDKYPVLSQVRFFIIGEDAAKAGLEPCLDFAIRKPEIKNDAEVLIITDKTANEIIESSKEDDTFLGESLESVRSKEEKRVKGVISTLDTMQKHFSEKNKAFCAINLKSQETTYTDGYCVFTDGKLSEILDSDTSRGIDYVIANIKSDEIFVENQFGAEITNIKIKRKADVQNNKVTFEIKTDFTTEVRQMQNLSLGKNTKAMAKMQNEYIEMLMNKAISYVKNSGNDILEIESLLKAKKPKEWEEIKNSFNVKDVNFKFETKSEISKTENLELTEES